MGRAIRRGTCAVLATAACTVLLAGCTEETPVRAAPGPTATTTAAPPEALALAERYRAAGGDADVYGIQQESTADGVPLLIVRTRNANTDDPVFKKQAASITSFLAAGEGLSLSRGYRMNVYGPDGGGLHQWDATP
ncbi:hypothetical protein [Streptomyces sp. NBC_00091]|uniref:hypothetical protein n=1 Tax=Streptomyces sp. NBC_00091 TaxID=2975648 RepID=UPI00224F5A94|nr:hypothetical protein [Streptomyces sp. NBC_00091]MCX5379832.1 hypothetical protein [Streptomyces sp. NBC_00091]